MGQIDGIDDIGERIKEWSESGVQEGGRVGSDLAGKAIRKGSDAAIKSFRNGSKVAKDSIQGAINSGVAPASTVGVGGTTAGAGTVGAGVGGATAGATAGGATAGAAAGTTAATGAAAAGTGAAGSAGTATVGAGTTATAVNLTNPVGWVILIVTAVLLVLLAGYIMLALLSFFVGDKEYNLSYLDYENVGDVYDSDTNGSYSADKSKMSSANLAVLAYYEELSSKTVLQEYKDENGNIIYIPYNDSRAKHDKFNRDKDLCIDYNVLFAMNDAVFGETYVYPEGFLNPVAHDKDYNLCAISDEKGNLNSLFTTGKSNMSYPEKGSSEATTEGASTSTTEVTTEASTVATTEAEKATKKEEKEAKKDLEATQKESTDKTKLKDTDLVVVKDYIPDIMISLPYASTNNFTKQKIYENEICYLRYGTIKKLSKVQDAVKAAGYGGLLIWDGYRPQSAVDRLYDAYTDKTYVAQRSNHTKGNTVDLTIVDKSGKPIEMPSAFDTFDLTADTDYSDVSEQAGINSTYLTEVMEKNGFKGYSSEWWHFTDSKDYDYQDELADTIEEGSNTTSTIASDGTARTATADFSDIGISTLCSYKQATSSTYLKGNYVSKILVNSETGEEKSETLDKVISYNIPLKTETFDVLDKTVSMWESVTYNYIDAEACVSKCSAGRSTNPSENVSQIQMEDEVRTEEVTQTVLKYPVMDGDKEKKLFDTQAEAEEYITKHSKKGYTLGTPYEVTETVKKEITYHVYYVRDSNSGLYSTTCSPSGSERKSYDNTYLYQYLQSAVINAPNVERDYEVFKNFSSYAGSGAFAGATTTIFGADGQATATSTQQAFIDYFAPLCIEEAKHTGIYPSLIMAQILLESSWGTSTLAENCWNYVGMTHQAKYDGEEVEFWDGSTWTRKTYQGTDRGWADFSTCSSIEEGQIACIRYYGRNFWTSGYYDDCGVQNHISSGLSIEEANADCLKQLSEYAPIYAPPTENYNYEGKIQDLMDDFNLYALNEQFLAEGGWDGTVPYEKNSSGGNTSGSSGKSLGQAGSLNDEDRKTFSMFYHAVDKDVLDNVKNLTYTTHELNLGEYDVDEILRIANCYTYGLTRDEEQSEFAHDDLLSMSLLIKDRKNGLSKGGSPATDWVFYKQYEGPWAKKMYGSNSYAASGCGPTSLAMCIASLVDEKVTPDVVGAACVDAGYRTANQGTANGYCTALADKFGYYCEMYSVSDPGVVEKVENCLRTGGAVCWSSGSQPFTANAHCMALRGITDDGKWLVADPNDSDVKNHNTTEFDPEFITSRWHNVVELIWAEKP